MSKLSNLFQLGATITELVQHYDSMAVDSVSGNDARPEWKERRQTEYAAAMAARKTALQLLAAHQALIAARTVRDWS